MTEFNEDFDPEAFDMTKPYDAIIRFIDDYSEESGGQVLVAEYGMMMYVIMGRIRQALYFPETAAYTIRMLQLTEKALQDMQESGEPIIVAEHWREMEDGKEMMADLIKGLPADTIPEDWL